MQRGQNCGEKNEKEKNFLRLQSTGPNATLPYGINQPVKNARNVTRF